jgi:hypothetical protein
MPRALAFEVTQACRGLVQQQQARIRGKRARNLDDALLASASEPTAV